MGEGATPNSEHLPNIFRAFSGEPPPGGGVGEGTPSSSENFPNTFRTFSVEPPPRGRCGEGAPTSSEHFENIFLTYFGIGVRFSGVGNGLQETRRLLVGGGTVVNAACMCGLVACRFEGLCSSQVVSEKVGWVKSFFPTLNPPRDVAAKRAASRQAVSMTTKSATRPRQRIAEPLCQ